MKFQAVFKPRQHTPTLREGRAPSLRPLMGVLEACSVSSAAPQLARGPQANGLGHARRAGLRAGLPEEPCARPGTPKSRLAIWSSGLSSIIIAGIILASPGLECWAQINRVIETAPLNETAVLPLNLPAEVLGLNDASAALILPPLARTNQLNLKSFSRTGYVHPHPFPPPSRGRENLRKIVPHMLMREKPASRSAETAWASASRSFDRTAIPSGEMLAQIIQPHPTSFPPPWGKVGMGGTARGRGLSGLQALSSGSVPQKTLLIKAPKPAWGQNGSMQDNLVASLINVASAGAFGILFIFTERPSLALLFTVTSLAFAGLALLLRHRIKVGPLNRANARAIRQNFSALIPGRQAAWGVVLWLLNKNQLKRRRALVVVGTVVVPGDARFAAVMALLAQSETKPENVKAALKVLGQMGNEGAEALKFLAPLAPADYQGDVATALQAAEESAQNNAGGPNSLATLAKNASDSVEELSSKIALTRGWLSARTPVGIAQRRAFEALVAAAATLETALRDGQADDIAVANSRFKALWRTAQAMTNGQSGSGLNAQASPTQKGKSIAWLWPLLPLALSLFIMAFEIALVLLTKKAFTHFDPLWSSAGMALALASMPGCLSALRLRRGVLAPSVKNELLAFLGVSYFLAFTSAIIDGWLPLLHVNGALNSIYGFYTLTVVNLNFPGPRRQAAPKLTADPEDAARLESLAQSAATTARAGPTTSAQQLLEEARSILAGLGANSFIFRRYREALQDAIKNLESTLVAGPPDAIAIASQRLRALVTVARSMHNGSSGLNANPAGSASRKRLLRKAPLPVWGSMRLALGPFIVCAVGFGLSGSVLAFTGHPYLAMSPLGVSLAFTGLILVLCHREEKGFLHRTNVRDLSLLLQDIYQRRQAPWHHVVDLSLDDNGQDRLKTLENLRTFAVPGDADFAAVLALLAQSETRPKNVKVALEMLGQMGNEGVEALKFLAPLPFHRFEGDEIDLALRAAKESARSHENNPGLLAILEKSAPSKSEMSAELAWARAWLKDRTPLSLSQRRAFAALETAAATLETSLRDGQADDIAVAHSRFEALWQTAQAMTKGHDGSGLNALPTNQPAANFPRTLLAFPRAILWAAQRPEVWIVAGVAAFQTIICLAVNLASAYTIGRISVLGVVVSGMLVCILAPLSRSPRMQMIGTAVGFFSISAFWSVFDQLAPHMLPFPSIFWVGLVSLGLILGMRQSTAAALAERQATLAQAAELESLAHNAAVIGQAQAENEKQLLEKARTALSELGTDSLPLRMKRAALEGAMQSLESALEAGQSDAIAIASQRLRALLSEARSS